MKTSSVATAASNRDCSLFARLPSRRFIRISFFFFTCLSRANEKEKYITYHDRKTKFRVWFQIRSEYKLKYSFSFFTLLSLSLLIFLLSGRSKFKIISIFSPKGGWFKTLNTVCHTDQTEEECGIAQRLGRGWTNPRSGGERFQHRLPPLCYKDHLPCLTDGDSRSMMWPSFIVSTITWTEVNKEIQTVRLTSQI